MESGSLSDKNMKSPNLKKEFGKHYLVEYYGCDIAQIKFVDEVQKVLKQAAIKSQATLLKDFYYQFEPYGVSGIIFIAESHFSIHTWPEDQYAALDILTCGQMYPLRAIEDLKLSLRAERMRMKIIPRGIF